MRTAWVVVSGSGSGDRPSFSWGEGEARLTPTACSCADRALGRGQLLKGDGHPQGCRLGGGSGGRIEEEGRICLFRQQKTSVLSGVGNAEATKVEEAGSGSGWAGGLAWRLLAGLAAAGR